MKNYCTKDGKCSAKCLEETQSCAFSAQSTITGDPCMFCNRNSICMSPAAHKDANKEDK